MHANSAKCFQQYPNIPLAVYLSLKPKTDLKYIFINFISGTYLLTKKRHRTGSSFVQAFNHILTPKQPVEQGQ